MNLVFIFAITFCSISHGTSQILMPISLPGFKTAYITFIDNMVPAYQTASVGINASLPNSNATTTEQLNAWQNVIGQITPLYVTCEAQINLLIANLFNALSFARSGPSMRFTPCDMITFLSNLQLIAAGDASEIIALSNLQGAINLATTSQFGAFSPQYTVNAIVAADTATKCGNEDISHALYKIASVLNETQVLSYQHNNQSVDFIKTFRSSFNNVQKLYHQISETIKNGANNFYQNGINSTTNTINGTALSNLVINTNQELSSLYEQVGNAFSKAKATILGSS